MAVLCSISLCIVHFFMFTYLIPWGNNFHKIVPGLKILVSDIIIIFTLNIAFVILKNKWSIVIKVLSVLINTAIIFDQLFMCVGVYSFNYIMTNPNYDYKKEMVSNSLKYTEAKKTISCSKCIKHFPKTIPENVKNIEFYKYSNWFGAEGIFLEFDVGTDYIENNIKQHKCNYLSLPNDLGQNRKLHTNDVVEFKGGFIDTKDYTFCILNPLKTHKKRFVPQYGIAIHKNNIIYYYNKKD